MRVQDKQPPRPSPAFDENGQLALGPDEQAEMDRMRAELGADGGEFLRLFWKERAGGLALDFSMLTPFGGESMAPSLRPAERGAFLGGMSSRSVGMRELMLASIGLRHAYASARGNPVNHHSL